MTKVDMTRLLVGHGSDSSDGWPKSLNKTTFELPQKNAQAFDFNSFQIHKLYCFGTCTQLSTAMRFLARG